MRRREQAPPARTINGCTICCGIICGCIICGCIVNGCSDVAGCPGGGGCCGSGGWFGEVAAAVGSGGCSGSGCFGAGGCSVGAALPRSAAARGAVAAPAKRLLRLLREGDWSGRCDWHGEVCIGIVWAFVCDFSFACCVGISTGVRTDRVCAVQSGQVIVCAGVPFDPDGSWPDRTEINSCSRLLSSRQIGSTAFAIRTRVATKLNGKHQMLVASSIAPYSVLRRTRMIRAHRRPPTRLKTS